MKKECPATPPTSPEWPDVFGFSQQSNGKGDRNSDGDEDEKEDADPDPIDPNPRRRKQAALKSRAAKKRPANAPQKMPAQKTCQSSSSCAYF